MVIISLQSWSHSPVETSFINLALHKGNNELPQRKTVNIYFTQVFNKKKKSDKKVYYLAKEYKN